MTPEQDLLLTDLLRRNRDLVDALEARDDAVWLTRPVDAGFVYCFIGGDLISFELLSGIPEDEAVPSDWRDNPAGIAVRARNVTSLFLPGVDTWERLLILLKRARVDDADEYVQRSRSVQDLLVQALRP